MDPDYSSRSTSLVGILPSFNSLAVCAAISAVCAAIAVWRLFTILPRNGGEGSKSRVQQRYPTCKLSVFLGSGGHTSESLALISGLDFNKYRPRIYYVSEGDTLSAHKAIQLEQAKIDATREVSKEVVAYQPGPNNNETQPIPDLGTLPFKIVVIPRARRVHQSILTTPATALVSLLSCLYFITIEPLLQRRRRKSRSKQEVPPSSLWRADQNEVLVLNGPGTCLMLAAAVYVNRFLALPSPVIVYVESFARVNSLSLSGKLIQPFADRFIVQWPQLLKNIKTGEHHGWLV